MTTEPQFNLNQSTASSESPSQDWYYIEKGVRKGPVAAGHMIAMYGTGQFTPDTLVWRQGYADWTALSATELAHSFTQPPPVHRSQIPNAYV